MKRGWPRGCALSTFLEDSAHLMGVKSIGALVAKNQVQRLVFRELSPPNKLASLHRKLRNVSNLRREWASQEKSSRHHQAAEDRYQISATSPVALRSWRKRRNYKARARMKRR